MNSLYDTVLQVSMPAPLDFQNFHQESNAQVLFFSSAQPKGAGHADMRPRSGKTFYF